MHSFFRGKLSIVFLIPMYPCCLLLVACLLLLQLSMALKESDDLRTEVDQLKARVGELEAQVNHLIICSQCYCLLLPLSVGGNSVDVQRARVMLPLLVVLRS